MDEYAKLKDQFFKTELKTTYTRTRKQRAELKAALKSKAMSRAYVNVRREE